MSISTAASALNLSTFDQRAKMGETLRVAFLRGSLTWGAGATDPLQTSYGALTQENLIGAYPEARFVFKDAAIGGSRSTLDAFRLERDVLAFQPDQLWDLSADKTHPGDAGCALHAEAVWQGFQQAIAEKQECRLPEKMLNGNIFMTVNRWLLADLAVLPEGWAKSTPHRIGCAFDFVYSSCLPMGLIIDINH